MAINAPHTLYATGTTGKLIEEVTNLNIHKYLAGHLGGRIGGLANKAFGNMTYEKTMSEYKEEYRIYDFRESVRLTERE